MSADIISTKWNFSYFDFNMINHSSWEIRRRKVSNSIKLLRGSTTDLSNYFFARSDNTFNYFHPHSIIELNDTKLRSNSKKFFKTKSFDTYNWCTCLVCFSCGICKLIYITGIGGSYLRFLLTKLVSL